MKRLNGYENAKTYTDQERLPVGGYILKIIDVEYLTNDWGDVILLHFDIAEGEQKGFFQANYNAQTGEDKSGKETTGLGCQRTMAVKKMNGLCAGLRPSFLILKSLIILTIGTGMSRL